MDQLETRPVTEPPPPEEPVDTAAPVTRAEMAADRAAMLDDVKQIVASAVTESVAPIERARDHDRRAVEKTDALKLFGAPEGADDRFTKHWDAEIAPLLERRPALSALTIPELVKMTGYDEHVSAARTGHTEARKAGFLRGLGTFSPPPRRASPVNREGDASNAEKKTMREAALDIVMEHYSNPENTAS